MPDTNHPSRIRVPLSTEPPDLTGIVSRVREDLTALLRYPCTDAADRDARYVNLPRGAEVYSTRSNDSWFKASDPGTNVWVTEWRRADDVPIAGRWSSSFTDTSLTARIRGSAAQIQMRATWSGAALTVDSPGSGNLIDAVVVSDMPREYWPTADRFERWSAGSNTGDLRITNDGRALIAACQPNRSVAVQDGDVFYAGWVALF